MPQPTIPPPKLLENCIHEGTLDDLNERGPIRLMTFLHSICSEEELRDIETPEQVIALAYHKMKNAANGPLIKAITTKVLRKALELAAEKAQMIYVNDNPPCSEGSWEVDKQSILDIEKLFL